MFNWCAVMYGTIMAVVDSVILSFLKLYKVNKVSNWIIIISCIIYAIQPLIFLKSLSYSSMTIMNLNWDLMSDLIVTFIGVYILKEKITTKQFIGICLSFIAVILMNS